jgi:hypothetical protein
VAVDLPISDAELRILSALVEARVEFMIVGLSAAALQGAPVVTDDVDLWFKNLGVPGMVRAIRAAGATYVPLFDLNPPMLVGDHAQPFDLVINMSGLGEYDDEIENTVEIKLADVSVRVLSLERIIASKAAANRPKDRLVIPVLRNTLATLQVLPTGGSARRTGRSGGRKAKPAKRNRK